MKSIEAFDFTIKKKNGPLLTRKEYDAMMDKVYGSVTEVRDSSTTIDKLIPVNAGEVTVEATSKADMILATPDGKTHELAGTGRSRDTWVSTSYGWRLKYSEELDSSSYLDGKPVQ
jgi:hypothetical protein